MKNCKIIICVLLLLAFQVTILEGDETISPTQVSEIMKNLKSNDSDLIANSLQKIKKNPDISLDYSVREQLVRLAITNESYYTPVLSVLKITRHKVGSKRELHIKFEGKEISQIINQLKSVDRETFFVGYNKMTHAFATNKNADLAEENVKFDVDDRILKQLDKNLDRPDRFKETDRLTAHYLYSYAKPLYEKRIRMLLLQSTNEACENTLTVLGRDSVLLKKHIDDVVDLANSNQSNEVKMVAIRTLKTLNAPEIIAKIKSPLLDITKIINTILTAYQNNNAELILSLADEKYGLVISPFYAFASRNSLFPYDKNSICGSSGTAEDAKRFLIENNCLAVSKNSILLDDDRVIQNGSAYVLNANLSSIDHTGHFYKDKFFSEARFNDLESYFSINFVNSETRYDFSKKCGCNNKVIVAICAVKDGKPVFLGMTGAAFNIE